MVDRLDCIGLDEVGRGAWAGPLLVAAVQLVQPVAGLVDSKRLTARRRSERQREIVRSGAIVGLGWVSAQRIDESGLSQALQDAAHIAISYHSHKNKRIVIDGTINWFPELDNVETIVKADAKVSSVAAASIVAKEMRDSYMQGLEFATHHTYGFDQHVGYGTALHAENLKLHGTSSYHRMSFKPLHAFT